MEQIESQPPQNRLVRIFAAAGRAIWTGVEINGAFSHPELIREYDDRERQAAAARLAEQPSAPPDPSK